MAVFTLVFLVGPNWGKSDILPFKILYNCLINECESLRTVINTGPSVTILLIFVIDFKSSVTLQ